MANATKRCDTSCREGVTLRNVGKIATLRNALRKVELTSTFRNDCGNKKKLRQMSVAGYVTLGNISCNLCCNRIARQVAREIA